MLLHIIAGDKWIERAVVMDTGSLMYILNTDTDITGRVPIEESSLLLLVGCARQPAMDTSIALRLSVCLSVCLSLAFSLSVCLSM